MHLSVILVSLSRAFRGSKPIYKNLTTFHRWLIGSAFLFALSPSQAQTLIIPQIADGGGWQTTVVLTNTTASTASASLSFYQEASGGGTQSWVVGYFERTGVRYGS